MPRIKTRTTPHHRTPHTPAPAATTSGSVQVLRAPDAELRGTAASHQLGDVRLRTVTSGPCETISPACPSETADEGFVRILRPLSGELWVLQDGRSTVLRAPQFALCDTTRPYRIVMPEALTLVELLVPHRRVGISPRHSEALTVRPWCGASGIAALASGLIAGLDEHGTRDRIALDLLGSGVAGLAAALLAERMQLAPETEELRPSVLMLRIQAFIRERLADPGLCPALVADHHKVSLRYLQKMFQEHGTSPARWIRDARLDRCRAELADPRCDHLPVAVVGERSGLYGAAHFSRVFRGRYGMTPRDYRRARTSVRTGAQR